MNEEFLEIETKYDANEIDRLIFKNIANSLNPKSFTYIESDDIYYVNKDGLFLRYRMPAKNTGDARAELTPKIKHKNSNNIIRTEPNLRIDGNDITRVESFCNSLGFRKNFSISKLCDIYEYTDVTLVYYIVIDESGKISNFVEIEAIERQGITQEEGMEVIQKYEKLLSSIGINAQKRKRLSLYEMYKK